MKETYKWVGKRPENIISTRRKSDLRLYEGEYAVQIDFTFEKIWCKIGIGNKLMLNNGGLTVVMSCLNEGGRVMGLPDLAAADNTKFVTEWRGMMLERVEDDLKKVYNIK